MSRIKNTILSLSILLAAAACSSDDALTDGNGQTVTLDVPISIYTGNEEVASRAASQGDPGNDAAFKAPLYLYIYAYIKESNTDGYEVLTQTFTYADDTEASKEWTLQDEGKVNERWQKNVRVTFKLSSEFKEGLGASRVYAVASRKELTSLPTDVSNLKTLADINALTLDLSKFTSDELKDIYSTPAKDQSSPVQSTDNGLIEYDTNTKTLTCSAVKLYHAAAKVDFTWEVPTALQPTTSIASITCTGVPTVCKIFEPTANPTTSTADCLVLGTTSSTATPVNEATTGNKWIGRAYAYMLQPASGTISYTVTYGGSAGRTALSTTFTPASVNNVFTGWYRIVADVK